MNKALESVIAEHSEIRGKHGRTLENDVQYNYSGELSMAASALINDDFNKFSYKWNNELCGKMLDKSTRDRLVIAAALIVCEIERLDAIG